MVKITFRLECLKCFKKSLCTTIRESLDLERMDRMETPNGYKRAEANLNEETLNIRTF